VDIKAWLEQVGEPVGDTAFVDKQPLPFIVFTAQDNRLGADLKNLAFLHQVRIERYTIDGIDNPALEALFDDATASRTYNGVAARKWTKQSIYISEEQMFETIYNLSFWERTD